MVLRNRNVELRYPKSDIRNLRRGPVEVRAGTPADVLAAVIKELDAANPRAALMNP